MSLWREAGSFQGEREKPAGTVSSDSQGAAREETRTQREHCSSSGTEREHRGWREQSCAPPGPRGCSLFPGQQRTRWTRLAPCKRSSPAPGQKLGLSLSWLCQAHTHRPSHGAHSKPGPCQPRDAPCQHPSASSHPRERSGMDKGQEQLPAMGLPLAPEPHHGSSPAGSTGDWEEARRCFSRNEVRRKVFLTKNCSLCLSVSGVNSLDIGMISPLRMIMALQ